MGARALTLSAASLALACISLALSAPAVAQDPTIDNTQSATPQPFQTATTPFGNFTRPDTTQPLNLEGDELIYDSAGERVTARGNVEILFNNYVLRADEVIYDQGAGTLTAIGNVSLKEPGGTVTRGERITLTDDFRDGFVEALSVRTADDSRITARRAIRRDGNVSVFEDGKFTPCKTSDGNAPLWCLSASRVTHDQAAATITYEDAAFELFGVPVLYLPWFQHADPSVKRKSGFLQPSFRHTNTLGFTFRVPYYFALSPSYDFTFLPSYMTQQGVFYEGIWRQKLAFGGVRGEYNIRFAAIDQKRGALPDDTDDDKRDDLAGFRGSLKTSGDFSLSSWWNFGWDVTLESDDTFRRFYKLDSVLQKDRVNSVYLVGQSERNFFSLQGYHFGGLSFSEPDSADSVVHPVLDWNYIFANSVLGGELSFNVNAVSLSREEVIGTGQNQQITDLDTNNSRVTLDINWRRKLIDQIGITYTPFANLRGDLISSNEGVNAASNTADNQSLARGVASAGVLAEYPWLARTRAASHVVAPIGQIIARTSLDDDDRRRVPNEDSRSLVFDDTNLFEVDKFSGFDRVETGSRANVGLQYTFQADTGGHARLLAGQSFQLSSVNPFRDPAEESFIDDNGLETRQSDFVFGAYLSPSRAFQVVAQARFDDQDFDLRQADVFALANLGPVFASATYAFKSQEFARETDTSDCIVGRGGVVDCEDQQELIANVGIRLDEFWTLTAGTRYDIDADFRLQDSIGIKYADECFVLAVSYSESRIDDPTRDVEPDQTVMIRFDLKHLGQFQTQSNIATLLEADGDE
ncbi:MAG: LPS-assembly protein LptD [Pseudomonadota bacterium]